MADGASVEGHGLKELLVVTSAASLGIVFHVSCSMCLALWWKYVGQCFRVEIGDHMNVQIESVFICFKGEGNEVK